MNFYQAVAELAKTHGNARKKLAQLHILAQKRWWKTKTQSA